MVQARISRIPAMNGTKESDGNYGKKPFIHFLKPERM